MDFKVEGMDGARKRANRAQRIFELNPVECEFAARDICEFVQNLDAQISATSEESFGDDRSAIVREGIYDDVRIEKDLRHSATLIGFLPVEAPASRKRAA